MSSADIRTSCDVPPLWRVVPAFVLAPAAPAFLYAIQTLFDGLPNGSYMKTAMTFLVVGGYLPTLLFGVPLLLALKGRVRPRLATVAVCGGLVAMMPWLFLSLFVPPGFGASTGGHETIIDGRYTLWGILELGSLFGGLFLLGALGGAAFWLVAVAGWRPSERRQ